MTVLSSSAGHFVTVNGRTYSYFAGNNYLGLSNHPEVKKEAISAIKRYGINFAASRQTTGTHELHLELEKRLSQFKGKEASMVYASGYMGDKMLMEGLKDRYETVFADESAHPSIIDGIPLAKQVPTFYRHCDVNHLESLLKAKNSVRPLIITDGIFALTGEIAPLDSIHILAEKYNALVIVDDAHATGVLGENGRGTPEYFNLGASPLIFQSETMSKAIGVYGGFISSDTSFIQQLMISSKFFSGSTSLPPPIAAGANASVKLLMRSPELRFSMIKNASRIRAEIHSMGFESSTDPTPIIPFLFNSLEKAKALSLFLFENGIIAPLVDYPVKTSRYIVRLTASAAHSENQISELIQLLKIWREKNDINQD